MKNEIVFGVEPRMSLVVLAFFVGCLSILLLPVALQPPPTAPAKELLFIATHKGWFGLLDIVVVTWSVFSVPLAAILAKLLLAKDSAMASAAQFLVAGGALLLGFGIAIGAGALFSILAVGVQPYTTTDTHQAAIWLTLNFFLADPGLMALGLGQLIFGWLAWRSGVLPNWVAIMGMVGGIAGLLTEAIYQSGVLALLQIICFAIWAFATGFLLLRARKSRIPTGVAVAKQAEA